MFAPDMPQRLDIETFLNRARGGVVVDVRSPAEFSQGHIPYAVNLPLFSDKERAEIGTAYVQRGRQPAILLGLKHVGPRMAELGASLERLAAKGELLIHCWRGGMRSASVAWLAETLGHQVGVLEGGYKSFRRWAIDSTGEGRQIRVLAGLTGTGKTQVLHALAARGEVVIDLEKLAHHKGSAFGDLGEEAQPTQEQFENDLALEWRQTRVDAPVWIEDESRAIGRCALPPVLWQAKKAAQYYVIELPQEVRLSHLCQVYSGHPADQLARRIEIIRKRLGGLRTSAAIHAAQSGDFSEACRIVLDYYDQAYLYALEQIPPEQRRHFSFEQLHPVAISETLCSTT